MPNTREEGSFKDECRHMKFHFAVFIVISILAFCVLFLLLPPYLDDALCSRRKKRHNYFVRNKDIFLMYLGICYNKKGHYPITDENGEVLKFIEVNNFDKFSDNERCIVEENGKKVFVDEWGTPFKYISEDGSTFLLISAGPDKIFNTKDDFWVTDKEEGRGKAPSLREGKTQKE